MRFFNCVLLSAGRAWSRFRWHPSRPGPVSCSPGRRIDEGSDVNGVREGRPGLGSVSSDRATTTGRCWLSLLVSFCLGLGVAAGGCRGDDDHDHPQLTTGQQLFRHHCARCHGQGGKGLLLLGVPANVDTALSREKVVRKIRLGSSSEHRMRSFRNMSYVEADRIAGYLLRLRGEGR